MFAFTSGAIIPPGHDFREAQPKTSVALGMLINLLPDFLAVADSSDPVAAYGLYFREHEQLLTAYWRNYVIEPRGPQFFDVLTTTATAARGDLRAMLARTDVVSIARQAEERCREQLEADVDFDIVLMVGVGAANAGELVVNGRGVAFACLEHFTGVANRETHGLGLDPELLSMWLAHEITHAIRYTSPTSRSELKALVDSANGNYSYWETARGAPLAELLVNEGLAVQASRIACPGHAEWEYFGYPRREFARMRELESAISRAASADLHNRGLGLRLRFLSGGMSERARTVDRTILPERSGYYLGARLVERAIVEHGLAWAVRASADELMSVSLAAQIA